MENDDWRDMAFSSSAVPPPSVWRRSRAFAGGRLLTCPVRLGKRGEITLPQAVRDDLGVSEGDILTLLQMGDVAILAPKHQVPRLTDKITELMEEEGVTLADLLQGLKEEREAIWRERSE
jgi:AbrB family looped-hinge helix DNA binding protein